MKIFSTLFGAVAFLFGLGAVILCLVVLWLVVSSFLEGAF